MQAVRRAVMYRGGLALIAVSLVACAQPLSKRERGALGGGALGAGAGAIIGSQKGHAAEGAAIGGALGALAGGVLGDRAQRQDAEAAAVADEIGRQQAEIERNRQLIEDLRKEQLEARASDRGVVVNLPDVLFRFGEAALTREARGKVRRIARIVERRAPDRRISVEGHTDAIGSAEYNQRLSEARAHAVASALVDNGVAWDHLGVKGWGELSPVAPNRNPDGTDNPAGRRRNRRVEVIILN